jgi:transcription antitermination factor NusG
MITEEPRWYAVYTRCRHEKQVATFLARQEIETFVPLRRAWSQRTDRKQTIQVPALPGYLFVRCALYSETRALIKRASGVLRLVEAAGRPAVIPERQIESLRAALVARHGEERGMRIAETNRNMLIYPNLVINDIMAVTVRTFMPSSPGQMDVTAWQLAAKGEHPAVRQTRLDNFLTFLGPAGFATPDDVEALESCQQGFNSGGVEWNDISRGMDRVPKGNDESQMRAFWRRWAEQMGPSDFGAKVTR